MHAESFSMSSVYWPTGLCATSINKLPILMLAILPCEGSVRVSIINWQLQTRQWDADCFTCTLVINELPQPWIGFTSFWVSSGTHII